jgi:hypothetical protein
MSTVSLIPPDDLDVVGLGSVKAGVPVDVPVQMAGVAPDPEREVQMQKLAAAIAAHNHAEAQACRDLIVGTIDCPPLEMGYGLLAQGWALAAPPAAPAPAAELTAAEKKAAKKAEEDAAEAAAATTDPTKEG